MRRRIPMRFVQKTSLLTLFIAASMALHGGIIFAEETKTPVPASAETKKTPAGEETKKPAPSAEEAKKAAPAATAAATSPDDILAKVNGTAITRGEVDRAVAVLVSQNRLPKPANAEQAKQSQDATLDQLVTAELLYQAGMKKEIKDLDKKVADRVAVNKGKFPSPAEFESALKSSGLTEKDLTDITRKDIVITNLVETDIAPKVTVKDEEIQKFYDQNKEKYFKQEEGVRASHILISADAKATPDEKQKAKEKAEAIRKRIVAGEDFAALAKTDSSCPSSKQGGDLGFFNHGQMVEPFEKAAFALKPGDVSDVVETQFGYHIIKVTDKKAGGYVPFSEAKEKIQNFLKSQKMQKAIADYSDDLKKKAAIEYPKK
jgi:peptidyl-prolyl cis-trans isomerase C